MWLSGTSLVARWLRFCALNAEGLGLIPGQGPGSHSAETKGLPTATNNPHATTMTGAAK